jgi:hypothetical protein
MKTPGQISAEINSVGKKRVKLSGLKVPSEKKAISKSPASTPMSEPRTFVSYRPTLPVHERLRTMSFVTRRPMQKIIDEAVVVYLERHNA